MQWRDRHCWIKAMVLLYRYYHIITISIIIIWLVFFTTMANYCGEWQWQNTAQAKLQQPQLLLLLSL